MADILAAMSTGAGEWTMKSSIGWFPFPFPQAIRLKMNWKRNDKIEIPKRESLFGGNGFWLDGFCLNRKHFLQQAIRLKIGQERLFKGTFVLADDMLWNHICMEMVVLIFYLSRCRIAIIAGSTSFYNNPMQQSPSSNIKCAAANVF